MGRRVNFSLWGEVTGNCYFISRMLFIEVTDRHALFFQCFQSTTSVISSIFISKKEKEKKVKFIEHGINYCFSVLMAASDVFLAGVHHRHGKQATSLNQYQCWSKNCPNKTPRKSFIRSLIQFITHHLCSPSLLRSAIFLQLREAGGIEVPRDAAQAVAELCWES